MPPPSDGLVAQGASPRPPSGLRERKKARVRQRIADVTLHLVSELGYRAATIDRIVAEVEISQPTFYKYFPSKDAVLMEHALRGFGRLLELMATDGGSVPERLRTYFAAVAGEITRDRQLWFTIALSNAYNPVRDPGLLRSTEAGTRTLEAVLAEGQRRGELTEDIAAGQLASVLEGTMMRACLEWAAGFPDGSPLEDRFEQMFDFFMRGAAP